MEYQHFLKVYELLDDDQRQIIPLKIQQKLQALIDSLTGKNVNLSNYNLIQQEELDNLICPSVEMKKKTFVTTLSSFINFQNIKEGSLHFQGDSKFLWNIKKIYLIRDASTLLIDRKNKNEKYFIPLKKYSIKRSNKWTSLDIRSGISHQIELNNPLAISKLKSIVMGSDNESELNQWYEELKKFCQHHNHSHQQSISKSVAQSVISEENKVQQIQSSSKSQLESPQIQNEERKSNKKHNLSDGKNSQKTIKVQEPEYPVLLKPIFSQNIVNKQAMCDEYNFNLISSSSQLRILQNNENLLQIKAFLTLKQIDLSYIISAFSNTEETARWNSHIDGKQSKTIQVIQDQKTLILYERRRKHGHFYLPRDFVYMRYIYQDQEGVFFIDKSTQHEDAKPSMLQVIRGEIIFNIWGIFKKDDTFLLVNYSQIENGGMVTTYQDTQITINYLLELANLDGYLSQAKFSPPKLPNFLANQFCQNQNYLEMSLNQQKQESEIVQTNFTESSENSEEEEDCKEEEQKLLEQSSIIRMENENSYMDLLNKKLEDVQQCRIHMLQLHQYERGRITPDETVDQDPIFKDLWQIEEKGGLKFIHKEKIELQKQVLKLVLKKIGSNLISGKSILNISLPVIVFDKRSNLEKFAYMLCYAPIFLEKAAAINDPIEQMKLTICFNLSTSLMYLTMDKPFNPILGETYQGRICGYPVYCEQLSHHPPIGAFQFFGKDFNLFGQFESQAMLGANSITGKNFGYIQVNFGKTQNCIKMNQTSGYLNGINFGERCFYLDGLIWLVDVKNQLIAELIVNPSSGFFNKKQNPDDYFEGGIYKVSEKEIQRFQIEEYKKFQGLKGNGQKLVDISGRWPLYIKIGGKEVVNWNKEKPFILQNEKLPLASDSRYREDLIAWQLDNMELSTSLKEKLENIQRADRKLREKYGPKKAKH